MVKTIPFHAVEFLDSRRRSQNISMNRSATVMPCSWRGQSEQQHVRVAWRTWRVRRAYLGRKFIPIIKRRDAARIRHCPESPRRASAQTGGEAEGGVGQRPQSLAQSSTFRANATMSPAGGSWRAMAVLLAAQNVGQRHLVATWLDQSMGASRR
jgi:hypothetical protein